MIRVLSRTAIVCAFWLFGVRPGAAAPVEFNRDIRPILSDACYKCHGPDARKRKAKLRLDSREGLFGKRKAGAPVVPGNPDASELFRRIRAEDSDDLMPPADSGKTLTPEQWRERG